MAGKYVTVTSSGALAEAGVILTPSSKKSALRPFECPELLTNFPRGVFCGNTLPLIPFYIRKPFEMHYTACSEGPVGR